MCGASNDNEILLHSPRRNLYSSPTEGYNVNKSSSVTSNGEQVCKTLYLLNIVPVLNSRMGPESWDEGYEVIPAGHVAVRHINDGVDILNDFKLEMFDIESEPCGVSPATEGLVNFYDNLTNLYNKRRSHCIVGIVGLYCSSMTQVIAPLVSLPQADYVTVAASTASNHRDTKQYPQLFHTIASFSVIQKAAVSMMRQFEWKRIGLVNDNEGVFFYSTAISFAKKIVEDPDLELVAHVPLNMRNISKIFDNLINREVRISFWSVSAEQAANVMCEAYRKRHFWEGYVHIFHGHTVQEILIANTSCTQDDLVKAINGVFLLNYDLSADSNETLKLVSDITYEQYYDEYMEELRNFSAAKGIDIGVSEWASSLYDQVWAFAIALNNVVDSLKNNTFDEHYLGGTESESLSCKIIEALEKVSFQGASGHIQFGVEHEVQTSVSIIRVQNGTEEVVGEFNPYNSNESIIHLGVDDVPEDRFETKYTLIPISVAMGAYTIQCMLFVFSTFNLILLIWWREKPSIKATSPKVSLFIFIGCYFLCVSLIAQTVNKSIHLPDDIYFIALCHLEQWLLFNGTNLIFATLLFRLLRIYHVFRVFRKTSKYWSDSFLFLYILLTCLVEVVVLSLWSAISSFQRAVENKYISAVHPPFYQVTESCASDKIGSLLSVSYFYSGLLLTMVMFLAVQTRHIQREAFKDTKKVNMFVFSAVAIVAVATPLQHHFSNIGKLTLEYLFKWFACFSVPLLCQVLLFSTKILPLLLKCWQCTCRSKKIFIERN